MKIDFYSVGLFVFLIVILVIFISSKSGKLQRNDFRINKIEYKAFIPEGSRPSDPRIAARVGAPAGTIEQGVIEKNGLWKREGYHGRFEKKLSQKKINEIFLNIQNVLEGKKEQPKYFNTAIDVKEMRIYYDGRDSLFLSYDSDQEQYFKVKNILEKTINSIWKINW